MIELNSVEISQWISQYLWPFFRIAAFLMVLPGIGNQLVPARIRLLLAVLITVLTGAFIDKIPDVDALSISALLITIEQVLLGVILAFFIQVFFHVFILMGQMIALQMGLGFASMIDPTNGVSVAVVSQFYLIVVTLAFFIFNGHHVLFEIVIESFSTIPLTGAGNIGDMLWQLAQSGAWLFSSALRLALPALTALLIVNFAFGIMTKAAPQMNVFSLGFPIALLVGLFILYVTLAPLIDEYQRLLTDILLQVREVYGMP